MTNNIELLSQYDNFTIGTNSNLTEILANVVKVGTDTSNVTISIPQDISSSYNLILPVRQGASGESLVYGADGQLKWDDPSVLKQVISIFGSNLGSSKVDASQMNSVSFPANYEASITPLSANTKIFVQFKVNYRAALSSDNQIDFYIYKYINSSQTPDKIFSETLYGPYIAAGGFVGQYISNLVDEPNTTDEITYKLGYKINGTVDISDTLGILGYDASYNNTIVLQEFEGSGVYATSVWNKGADSNGLYYNDGTVHIGSSKNAVDSQNTPGVALELSGNLVGTNANFSGNVYAYSFHASAMHVDEAFVGPNTLYIDGQRVLNKNDDTGSINVYTDQIVSDASNGLTIQANGNNGNIILDPSGTGTIKLNGDVELSGGNINAETFIGDLSGNVNAVTMTATTTTTNNLSLDGTLTTSNSTRVEGNLIPSANITYDLGSSTHMWRDVYVGPGSLYVNNKKVIEDNNNTINITTDVDQNLTIKTSGTGVLQLNSNVGGIDFNTSNGGTINFNSDIVLQGSISMTNTGSTIPINLNDDVDVAGNLDVTSNLKVNDISRKNQNYGVNIESVSIDGSEITGQLTGNVTGHVTGTVSSISNHTTDNLTQGSTNKYFSNSLVDTHLSGGTGVTYISGSISIGQPVGTSDNVQFNNITVDGVLNSDDITGTNVNVSNDLIVSGNLSVNGTQTIINSTILDISDNKIVVNAAGSQTTAGIIANVNGAEHEFVYTSSNNAWGTTGDLNIGGNVTATAFIGDGSQLTGISVGANLTNHSDASFGNVDISNNLQVEGNVNIDGTGTIDDLLIKRHFTTIAGLGHRDYYSTNNNGFALACGDNGDTYINAGSGRAIYFRINNSPQPLYITSTGSVFSTEIELTSGTELKTNGSYGTSGAVLTSNGSGSSPSWSSTPTFDTLAVNGNVTGNLVGAMTMTGHIIPLTGNTYDIGSPDKQIRDIYVSNNTIYLGEVITLSVDETTSELKVKKRKTDVIPKAIRDANPSITAEVILTETFGAGHGKQLSDLKLSHYRRYARNNLTINGKSGNNIEVSDILTTDSENWEEDISVADINNILTQIQENMNISGNLTVGSNVTIGGQLLIDTINENTTNNGVVIEGVTINSGNITATTFIGDGSQLTGISAGANLTNYSDASFANVDIRNTLTLINNNDIYYQQIGSDIDGEAKDDNSSYNFSVSLSSDGSIVAIGAPYNDGGGNNAGHVRVYQNINSVWTQLGGDIDGDTNYEQFGISLSLSSDGTRVAIGANKYDQVTFPSTDPNFKKGRVKIYEYDIATNSWIQLGSDIEGEGRDDGSGSSISLSSDGTIVAIGASGNDGNGSDSGHVRIYQYANNSWTQLGSDIDGEGSSQRAHVVSLSSDGTIVAIGAHRNSENGGWAGNVRVFKYLNNSWSQIGSDIYGESANDQAGDVGSVSLSSDGTILALGSIYNSDNGSNSGHVRVFQYNSNTSSWTQLGSDIDGEAANDYSGKVSLSSDGTTLAIGAHNAPDENSNNTGRVKVYRYTNNSWTQLGSNIYGDTQGDQFGYSLSISSDGTKLAVGAWGDDSVVRNSGHVRVYELIQNNVEIINGNISGVNTITATTFIGDGSQLTNIATLSSTDELNEGLTNKYFSTTLVNSHLSGGTGVTYSNGSISIGQEVGTSNDVEFNNVTVNGVLNSDDITGTNVNVSNDLIVSGNLSVNGTQTIINSTILDISDNKIVVNAAGSQTTAGIIANVNGAEHELIYNSSNSSWNCDSLNIANTLTVNGVTFASMPSGLIVMWSGSQINIPSGWVMCDGTNNTPDLRDRFIVGAGSTYNVDDTGGEASVTLQENEIPSHRHYIDSDVVSGGNHSHEVKGNSNSGGGHSHDTVNGNSRYGYEGPRHDNYNSSDDNRRERLICVTDGDNKNMKTTAGTYWDELIFEGLVTSYNQHHVHYIDLHSTTNGNHSHEIKTWTQYTGAGGSHENRPPYYALLYIMKT